MLSTMSDLFPEPQRWRCVSPLEFEQFLCIYPRPIEVRPPLTKKARFREFNDPTLGPWPGSTVAREFRIRRSREYWLRGVNGEMNAWRSPD